MIMKLIVVQEWEESERGWGCRPDGFSLHLTIADAKAYAKKFWDDEKKLNAKGGVPDEYSRECGSPQLIDVEDCVYEAVEAAKKKNHPGVRVWCRDLRKLAAEFRKQSPEEIANEKAIALDKQDEGALHLWAVKEAPEEFRNLPGLDKCKWVAYVPRALVKNVLPFKYKTAVLLQNGSEIRFLDK